MQVRTQGEIEQSRYRCQHFMATKTMQKPISFLRSSGYYEKIYLNNSCKDVKTIGSKEWYRLVSEEFTAVVVEICRISLEINEYDEVDVIELASKPTTQVEEDGGTHISLVLLLHRYADLRKLLSGCNLLQLKNDHEDVFQHLNIFERNNDIYIQSKVAKEGRMEVDETGLFSVASSKWGNAFASMMVSHCRSILSKDALETTAIDFTASIGGFVLPLAKMFSQVIAVEIDEHRAELCRRNMQTYGVAEKVEIRNKDSIEWIPDLAREVRGPKVVVIDPPWGGMHYKSEKEKPIMMGK